jgi:hypothetical protein
LAQGFGLTLICEAIMTITLTREEAQQVLDALQCVTPDWQKAVETLRTRLAQPEPEPVAWGVLNTRPTERQTLMMVMTDQPPPSDFVVPLYLAPPQREWQGLTDEEAAELCHAPIAVIEAKLKEKNAAD